MKKKLTALKRIMKGSMLKYVPGMVTCAEFEQFIDDYLDGSLTLTEATTFERHLKICRECRNYLEAYSHSIALGQQVFTQAQKNEEVAVPDTIPTGLVDAMLAARRMAE